MKLNPSGQISAADKVRRNIKKTESRFNALRSILSIVIALGIVLVIVLFVSKEPIQAIESLLLGPVSSLRRFGNVIELMIPLTFSGLAITIVFKSNRFNLAADGAFYMASMAAAMVGIFSPLPAPVTIVLAMAAGLAVGAIIGAIPALIEMKFGAGVLVVSLMLNYVVGYFVNYLFNYVVRDPYKSVMQSLKMQDGVNLGKMITRTNIHWGFVIMILVSVLCYIFLYKTKWGYALRATGENERFALYSGIPVTKVVILAQVIGTALAGLGGSVEMLGMHSTFKWTVSPGYGFDGVIIATLARSNPGLVPFAAFFLAYVRTGADILNRTSDIPAEIISIVQATIIVLVAAEAFLSKWKERQIVKQTGALEASKGGEKA